jgi:hypothetical protein
MEVSKFGIIAQIHTVSKVSVLSYGHYELSDSSMKSSGSDEFGKIPGTFML